jgi:hypothetical protein
MLLNGVNHVALLARDTGRVVAFYRESRHPVARRGLRRPEAAGLALAALLLIAGCGGSASTGHTARSALSCQQQADRIQTLATNYFYDSADGNQLKAIADLHGANALWRRMHKKHCPASSYTQLNRTLSGLGMTLHA